MGFSVGIFVIYSLKRCIVMDRQRIAQYYIHKDTFWVDLLSALPVVVEVAAHVHDGSLPGRRQQSKLLC